MIVILIMSVVLALICVMAVFFLLVSVPDATWWIETKTTQFIRGVALFSGFASFALNLVINGVALYRGVFA